MVMLMAMNNGDDDKQRRQLKKPISVKHNGMIRRNLRQIEDDRLCNFEEASSFLRLNWYQDHYYTYGDECNLSYFYSKEHDGNTYI